jgi:colanic acid biosynthesis glycosyl transferase WcaI
VAVNLDGRPAAEVRATAALAGVRVCIAGLHYAPETTGNAPYTTAMARCLSAAGAEVHVITGVPHYPQWSIQDDRYRRGLRWEEADGDVRLTRVRHAVPSVPNLVGRSRLEATFTAQAAAEVARDRSDVVIAVTPMLSALAAAVTAARGRPVGVLVQDLTGRGAEESGLAGGAAARVISTAETALMRRASLVGVITPRFGSALVDSGVGRDRIVDLPNFTHVVGAQVSQETARQRLGWPPAGFLAVHAGNMGLKQGLETVVDAARLAQDARSDVTFVMVGDGSQRFALEERARGIDRVRFTGPVSEENFPYVLAAADVLLVNEKPGVREMSLPSKLTSYASARRPILAAVEPGGITSTFLLEHSAALLTPAGAPAAMLDALHGLAREPERQRGLADAAADLVRTTFGAAAAEARYRDFTRRLLDACR